MTVQQANQHLFSALIGLYDVREARNITELVMENLTGWKKVDRVLKKDTDLPGIKELQLIRYTAELLKKKPVQYVLSEAWFSGMKFLVNEHVLIPRPETEELVQWVVSDCPLPIADLKILDIGTGSGCIAIALKKKLPEAQLFACDISLKALEVTEANAKSNHVQVETIYCDFLNKEERKILPQVDVIVSNPPYIPRKEMSALPENVSAFEPHLALFVNDDDVFLFYHAIAEFAKSKLSPKGVIYVEIHEDLALAVKELFVKKGFRDVETRKDMQGKNRMVKVANPSRG